jgi:putative transposase
MSSWPWVRALLHPVYDWPDAASVHAQFDRVLDALAGKAALRGRALAAAPADVLPFMPFVWRQIWDNNPDERLNREMRRSRARRRRHGLHQVPDSLGRSAGAARRPGSSPWPGEGDSACAGTVDA